MILSLFVVDVSACDVGLVIMFSQSLTICQRSLTTMQIQIQGLMQFSVPMFPTAEVSGWLTDHYTRLWKGVYYYLPFYVCYTERPFGDPATVELH